MPNVRVLVSSIDSAHADAFARQMCSSRLVACVNVLPGVRSHYWWDGALRCEDECVLLIETTEERLPAAMEHAASIHPYDTPKLIALEPAAVSEAFASWCASAVRERQR